MPRRRKAPLKLPADDLPAVGVQVTVVTTDTGIAIDIDVKVLNGVQGLEKTIGTALRAPARALGDALAQVLGTRLHEQPYQEIELVPTIAASRPGRS